MCSVAHLHCVQVEHLAASMRNQLNIEVGALGPSDAIRNMARKVCVCVCVCASVLGSKKGCLFT